MHAKGPLVLLLLLSALPAAAAPDAVRRVGAVTVTVDQASAHPGGLLVARLQSRRRLGLVYGILDGRRCPFFPGRGGLMALIPIPVGYPTGPATVGIEVRARRGRQRFGVPVTVSPRVYPERRAVLPEAKRALLASGSAVRDGRLVQLKLRTVSRDRSWTGPFLPPVQVEPMPSFASFRTFGEEGLEEKTDAVHGEHHRGLDYRVSTGTAVSAPAAGTILHAGPLTLTGGTVILDHGQGVISVFYHLGETRVKEGDQVASGTLLGLSGESGLVDEPQLHWGLYVHGVAVVPRVAGSL
jgi:murein DD-endopeptidase MepM/ murein hydrolase activator NlpD